MLDIYKFNKNQLYMIYKNSNFFTTNNFFKNHELYDIKNIIETSKETLNQIITEKEFINNFKEKIKNILTKLNYIFIQVNQIGSVIEYNKIYNDYFKTKNIKKIIPQSLIDKMFKQKIINCITHHKINNEIIYLEWTIFIYYKSSIDPIIYLIGNDQSKRKKLESKIIDMKKFDALGRLASGLSHDFKNYLTCINGYLELMEENKKYDHEIIEAALTTGNNAFKLVEQISSFSKSSSLFFDDFSLTQFFDSIKQIVKPLISENILIKIENNTNKNLMIEGDKDKLLQVILNLAINAKDAILECDKKKGTISIILSLLDYDKIHNTIKNNFNLKKSIYIKIAIIDNGVGIPPEVVQKIFEPFYTTKIKGTGLGLSIVLGIIKKHSGGLEINTIKNKGTTIFLYLPIKK